MAKELTRVQKLNKVRRYLIMPELTLEPAYDNKDNYIPTTQEFVSEEEEIDTEGDVGSVLCSMDFKEYLGVCGGWVKKTNVTIQEIWYQNEKIENLTVTEKHSFSHKLARKSLVINSEVQ